jgi:transmembrane sensor
MADDTPTGPTDPSPPLGGSDAEWDLIDRYVAGDCTPEETARVERLLAERPDLAEIVAALRRSLGIDADEDVASGWDAEAASARLARTIQGDAGADYRPAPQLHIATNGEGGHALDVGRSLRTSRWSALAAVAAVVLMAGGALLWVHRNTMPAVVAVKPPAVRVYTTQRGERGDMRLPDGTHVILAAESRLGVPVNFDSAGREVTLEGEAYFEATHDSSKPFTVLARHGVIRDLGTRFDVRAYPERRVVEVVVAEGKVDLRARVSRAATIPPAALLVRGQLGRLDTAGATTVRSGIDVERYTGWIDGRLAFDDTPLRDVVAQLARWYDLDISFAQPALGARHVTLLLRQQPVPKILDALALVTHTRYERVGRRVRFHDDAVRP